MKFGHLLVVVGVLMPSLAMGASKEIIELNRDVEQLQDQVRTLQRSFDERYAALQVLIQQSLDNGNRANTTLSLMDANLKDRLRAQDDRVGGVVSGFGSKVDGMQNDVAALRESVNDMTTRMGRIEQSLQDLSLTMKAMQAPAAAPPGPQTSASTPSNNSAGVPDGSGATGGTPPVSSKVLYENAIRDMNGGKSDLALGEFQDYLRFYGKTDMAPNAQFYVGQIHNSQGKLDTAIQDFDAVLEKYPANFKTADAHYMKGKALLQLGYRNKASAEFRAVVEQFPSSDVAANAKAQLRALGLNTPATTARRRR